MLQDGWWAATVNMLVGNRKEEDKQVSALAFFLLGVSTGAGGEA